jgi:hypothetical protein
VHELEEVIDEASREGADLRARFSYG